MSTRRGLRAVALFEAAKGALALLAGAGALALMHGHAQTLAATGIPSNDRMSFLLQRAATLDPRWLGGGVVMYALLRFVEAYGLWRSCEWAEWLAVASGVIYVPFEAWQLGAHFSWTMVLLLVLNLAAVGYVAQSRLAARLKPA